MPCPEVEVLDAFAHDAVAPLTRSEIVFHLEACPTCREWVDDITGNEGIARDLEAAYPRDAVPAPAALPAIPGYELVREIHRGGQGVVFAATQLSTGRTVAVKVLLQGPYASAVQQVRFEREVELAASLKHPGIVTVFDGGVTSDGWHYLAMELVEGRQLDVFLRQEDSGIAETLGLFREITAAVLHAHQRGVIHRDLKPGNILVDAARRARVLDFGLAKRAGQDDTSQSLPRTASWEFVGTLAYAAPEQTRSEPDQLDVRTDVYALGMLLYVMLTREHPYPVATDLREILRHISETTPGRPSSVRPGIDDDLDTITLKALAKDKTQRYQSVGDLARDLDHYLAHEPIEARAAEAWYVIRRFVQRHRIGVALAGVIVALIIGSAVVCLAFWQKSRADEIAALAAGDQARREADKANEIGAFLRNAFAAPGPRARGPKSTMLEFVNGAARDLDAHLPANPEAEALLRVTLGTTYSNLGQLDAAEAQFDRARGILERIRGPDDPATLEAAALLASALVAGYDSSRAGPVLESLRTRAARIEGLDAELTLEVDALYAMWLTHTGRPAEAEPIALRAVTKLEGRPDFTPDALPKAQLVYLDVLVQLNRLSEAESRCRSLLAAAAGDGVAEQIFRFELRKTLVIVLSMKQRFSEAIEIGRPALETSERLLSPELPLAMTLDYALGFALFRAGKPDEALPLLQRFLAAHEHVGYPFLRDVQTAAAVAAEILSAQDDFGGAEKRMRTLLDVDKKLDGQDHWRTLQAQGALGSVLAQQGRHDEAVTLLREALEIQARAPASPELTMIRVELLDRLANVLAAAGRNDDAEKARDEADRLRPRDD